MSRHDASPERPGHPDRPAAPPAAVRVRRARRVPAGASARRGAAAAERRVVSSSLSDVGGVRAEPHVAAHRPVSLAARGDADRRDRQERRWRRHVLAGAGFGADAGRLVPGRRLSDVLQGQVARLAPVSRRRGRRRVPAVDRRRRDADRGQHPEVPRCRPARRPRLFGVGRARPARTRQAQHRRDQGPVHRRRDDRAAQAPRRRRGRRAVADGVLVPEPARRLAVRRHRAHAGAALPPLTGAACRSGTDARGGPLDEALLPAELRRQLGQRSSRRSRGTRPT